MPLSVKSEQSQGDTTGPQNTLHGQSMDSNVHPRRSCLRQGISNDGTRTQFEQPTDSQRKTVHFVAPSNNRIYEHIAYESKTEEAAPGEDEKDPWDSEDDLRYMSPDEDSKTELEPWEPERSGSSHDDQQEEDPDDLAFLKKQIEEHKGHPAILEYLEMVRESLCSDVRPTSSVSHAGGALLQL